MMLALPKIINAEFELFKITTLASSKINIFSKAEEIFYKRKICECLVNNSLDFNEDEVNIILSFENFIDEIYFFILDKNIKFSDNNILRKAHEICKKTQKKLSKK